MYTYKIGCDILEHVKEMKDLGITIEVSMKLNIFINVNISITV